MRVLIKTKSGSRLYGAALSSSDTDYKVVFLPDVQDLIRYDVKRIESVTTGPQNDRNSAGDVDVEYIELRKFLELLSKGQTMALEILFTPKEFVIEEDPLWHEVREACRPLLTRKATAMVGYSKSQAHKFSEKGNRLTTLLDMAAAFENELKLEPSGRVLDVAVSDISNLSEICKWKRCKIVPGKTHGKALEVGGKTIPLDMKVSYALKHIIQPAIGKYGKRSQETAKASGTDYKSLYHTVRVACQGTEFLNTGHITFPRPERQLLLKIRKGELDSREVGDIVVKVMAELEKAEASSPLPKEPRWDTVNLWADAVYQTHLRHALGMDATENRQGERVVMSR
uniref:Nucleotidyltransferase n=1 Tax=Trieres chinensis TaxID=1514140 RepID=A0A7S2EYM5_TRICV|mmetsp:Transcript_9965/g.21064  ORF Transcript_9965/g.21064 Transcript_9965/m.21064 type:complete len:341 (+) Transcript_9965:29-1051(+)|eukprot:CAMPEP_0183297414 /NCGR_PEP_ID=MMETSP0160_2-20130417/4716_1 /TAXON_ID=2839 ORGANISM="Odontella Sinensis, Strain Grunow 1884" /NCGR_SAMPLE_ID=MMETSP0160_2 /ASSEMBLY_ACC=CAM_ASM_000250 /LENGTH=340 /DNA_ID=CAMNT_0025459237 /DNA_START=29 /DNA_END=1051 /DNA_ORIENTATION=-